MASEHTPYNPIDEAAAKLEDITEEESSSSMDGDKHETIPFFIKNGKPTSWQQKKKRRTSLWLYIHGLVFLAYILSSISMYAYFKHQRESILSRCNGAMSGTAASMHDIKREYAPKKFSNLTGNPYHGVGDAVDQAWEDILTPMNLRVSFDELHQSNLDSVVLQESDGKLVWLDVFHQVHCLNMVRKWLYHDHYFANLTAKEDEHMFAHVEHCVDFQRQTAICHADTSLTTFIWQHGEQRPMFNVTEGEHTCVDWQVFLDSFSGRVIAEDEMDRLKNPSL